MKIGYVGLGKMGLNMVERLLEKGHQVIAFDRNSEAAEQARARGAETTGSPESMVSMLPSPRLLWIMVPYQAVDTVLQELAPLLAKGDTIIDGGNSPYKESIRRAAELEKQEIDFLDVGVSGGPDGARNGACLMAGGRQEVFQRLEGLFRDLAAPGGFGYMGRAGTGHFVKMVHNGIEYGMMQALAEGFAIMRASAFGLDLAKIAALYNNRSVIESRLVGWLRSAYEQYGEGLQEMSATVAQSGEGAWTVEAARELGIFVPVIEKALEFRIQSGASPSYTGKVLSALRHQFGGHDVKAKR